MTNFPLFSSIRDDATSNQVSRWNAYYTLLNPEREFAPAPELTPKLVGRISLVRLALAEADFSTVLRTFVLDSCRFASPEYSAGMSWKSTRRLRTCLGAPERRGSARSKPPGSLATKESATATRGSERSGSESAPPASLRTGLCTCLPQPSIRPVDSDLDFPSQVPVLLWQILSVGSYDFLASQVNVRGDPLDSVFARWIFQTLMSVLPADSFQLIAERVDWMTTMLDRLLVQGKLEIPTEEGWNDYDEMEWDDYRLPSDRRHIPLEELLNSPLAMVTSVGRRFEDSDQQIYERVIEHLIERGVQPERLRIWIAEIRGKIDAAFAAEG